MRSGNWNSAYKGLQSRLTMGLFRLLYIAGSQRPVKIDELRHATTIWTPGDLPHRHWSSYRTKTICFVLVMFIYLIYVGRVLPVHNLLLDGYTRPHLHSTRPKDGWTGPWMRQCITVVRWLWLGAYIVYDNIESTMVTKSTVRNVHISWYLRVSFGIATKWSTHWHFSFDYTRSNRIRYHWREFEIIRRNSFQYQI